MGFQDFNYIRPARGGPALAPRCARGERPPFLPLGEAASLPGFATGVIPTRGTAPRLLYVLSAVLRGARGRSPRRGAGGGQAPYSLPSMGPPESGNRQSIETIHDATFRLSRQDCYAAPPSARGLRPCSWLRAAKWLWRKRDGAAAPPDRAAAGCTGGLDPDEEIPLPVTIHQVTVREIRPGLVDPAINRHGSAVSFPLHYRCAP